MENVVADKSKAFAIRIVRLYQFLTVEKKEYVLSKQLLRSGTSIGAIFGKGCTDKVVLIFTLNLQLL